LILPEGEIPDGIMSNEQDTPSTPVRGDDDSNNSSKSEDTGTVMTIFCDASHLDEYDYLHTTISYVIFVGNNMIKNNARRRKNHQTATTAGSELMTLFEVYEHGRTLYRQYKAQGFKFLEPLRIFCDNEAGLKILSGGKITEKCRHLKPKVLCIRKDRAEGKCKLGYVRTDKMPVDLTTKGSRPEETMIRHSKALMQGEVDLEPGKWY